MPQESIEAIKARFFAFGCLPKTASPDLIGKIKKYGTGMQIRDVDGHGSFFFTTPFYADVYEDGDMVWIKLGLAHGSGHRLTTQEMVKEGWLHRGGIESGAFQGSVTLAGFSKQEERCYIYRNLLSPAGLVYKTSAGTLLLADNLRLLTHFLEEAVPNEEVVLHHHINRQVFGENTYIQGVKNLLGGEMITWLHGDFGLESVQDFRHFENQTNQKFITPDTVDWFFRKLSQVIGYRLHGHEQQSATLLSGGVDSSTMQAAINSQAGIDLGFPSFSFVVDSPGFQFEVEYAKEAADLLGTEHSFLNVEPNKFPDWLVSSVSILGMPVHFDAPPSYFAIAQHIENTSPKIKYLFNGANADVLTGNSRTMDLVQGDKYRSWPIWMLKGIAALLKPFSPSKSYGAGTAAEVLTSIEDWGSIDNPFNRSSTCDWELVMNCFPASDIQEVFQEKMELIDRYSSSNFLSERRQILSLVQDGMSTPGLERQLGLFCGREMRFPFTDDAMIETVFSFEPIDRYSHDYRVKPLMRMALETQVPLSVTRKQKGNSSAFEQAIIPWMRDGSLRALVQEIDRPGYISQPDFQEVLDNPGWFTWTMLTLDLFKKYGIK